MARCKSCKNCYAYKYKFLYKVEGKCALGYSYLQSDDKIIPAESCQKPRDINQMHIYAKNRGIDLSGNECMLSEKDYNIYHKFRSVCNSIRKQDSFMVAKNLSEMSDMIYDANK